MTINTISGYHGEITLSPGGAYGDPLTIAPTGTVSGSEFGIYASSKWTIDNAGTITGGSIGIDLQSGGSITNETGGTITGQAGVSSASKGATIENFGEIYGESIGVQLLMGGKTVNETSGTIGGGSIGIDLENGGSITNEVGGTITGQAGVSSTGKSATIENFGGIYGKSIGIQLLMGGKVSNGAAGTIAGGNYGVYLASGGSVVNEAGGTITGVSGVEALNAAATVINQGSIRGSALGVYLGAGGSLTNAAGATIAGGYAGQKFASGVDTYHAAATINNHGGIGGGEEGIYLGGGGSVINAAGATITGGDFGVFAYDPNGGASVLISNGSKGLIEGGYDGVDLFDNGKISNFGTIEGTNGYGIDLIGYNATIINGSNQGRTGVIQGNIGIGGGSGENLTVTNYGTIGGSGGTAVDLSGGGTLVVEAGCVFKGAVTGKYSWTLDLATGTGILTGLISPSGDVTVSGSIARTTFSGVGVVQVGAAGQFKSSGAVTTAVGQSIIDAGTLTLGGNGAKNAVANAGLIEATGSASLAIAGPITNTGTLSVEGGTMTVAGAVTGTGVATISAGALDLTSSFNQAVTFGKAGVLELARSQTYTATITGFSKTGVTSLDLADIGFVKSTEATYSGTKTSGVLTVSDGTHTAQINLDGNYTTSVFVASSDGHGGVIVTDSPPQVATHQFIAAMAGMCAMGGEAIARAAENHTFSLGLAPPRISNS